MKQPNFISSYDSDDVVNNTYSENFDEENDALLPRSHTKRQFKASNQQEDNESSIQFRIGSKKRLKVSTISYSYTLFPYKTLICACMNLSCILFYLTN